MRILKETKANEFKVTIFHWNNKYLLKFEDGANEITYKINQLDISTESDIDLFLTDPELMNKVRECFDAVINTLDAFFSKV
jgi:hypothetical protein